MLSMKTQRQVFKKETDEQIAPILKEIDQEGPSRPFFKSLCDALPYEFSICQDILYWLSRYRLVDVTHLGNGHGDPGEICSLEQLVSACRKRVDQCFLGNYAVDSWIMSYLRSKGEDKSEIGLRAFIRAAVGQQVLDVLARLLPDYRILDCMVDVTHEYDRREWLGITRHVFRQYAENELSALCREHVINVKNVSEYFVEEFVPNHYEGVRNQSLEKTRLLPTLIDQFKVSHEEVVRGSAYKPKYFSRDHTMLDFDLEHIFGNEVRNNEKTGHLDHPGMIDISFRILHSGDLAHLDPHISECADCRSRCATASELANGLARKLATQSQRLKIPRSRYYEYVPVRFRIKRGDAIERWLIPSMVGLILIAIIFVSRTFVVVPVGLLFYALWYFSERHGGIESVIRKALYLIRGIFRR